MRGHRSSASHASSDAGLTQLTDVRSSRVYELDQDYGRINLSRKPVGSFGGHGECSQYPLQAFGLMEDVREREKEKTSRRHVHRLSRADFDVIKLQLLPGFRHPAGR